MLRPLTSLQQLWTKSFLNGCLQVIPGALLSLARTRKRTESIPQLFLACDTDSPRLFFLLLLFFLFLFFLLLFLFRGIRIQALFVSCTSICFCPLCYWIPGLCLQMMAASWSWGPSFFTARVTCSTLLSGKECLQVSADARHDNNGKVTEDWQR